MPICPNTNNNSLNNISSTVKSRTACRKSLMDCIVLHYTVIKCIVLYHIIVLNCIVNMNIISMFSSDTFHFISCSHSNSHSHSILFFKYNIAFYSIPFYSNFTCIHACIRNSHGGRHNVHPFHTYIHTYTHNLSMPCHMSCHIISNHIISYHLKSNQNVHELSRTMLRNMRQQLPHQTLGQLWNQMFEQLFRTVH